MMIYIEVYIVVSGVRIIILHSGWGLRFWAEDDDVMNSYLQQKKTKRPKKQNGSQLQHTQVA